jgi:apolipoprotein N-acyltransferase
MLRVPFGEYMPLKGLLPFLRRIEGGGRLSPGEQQVLLGPPGARFVFLICYEAIHPRFVRESAALVPDLFVNLTYDGWFGRTRCRYQHLMLSAIQAALYGRPLLRAATTGISAVVDPRGQIVAATQLFERSVLVANVPLVQVPTLYASIGDAFAWLCAGTSLVALARSEPATGRRRGNALRGDAVLEHLEVGTESSPSPRLSW